MSNGSCGRLAAMGAAAILLAAVALPAWADGPALEPIKTVEIGKNRQFIVNGKAFFPIMSWAQSPKTYATLAEVGMNTHVGSADPKAAQAAGCYAVPGFKADLAKEPFLLGWIHGDEPDMPKKKDPNFPTAPIAPRRTAEELAATYQKIKDADKAHPVFVTFTGAFTKEDTKYDAATRARLYPAFVQSADVVGFDIYPIYGSGYAGHLDWVAKGVTQLRDLAPKKPLYAWIETSKGSQWMTYEKQPDVLPIHTRNEVWQAVIRGATAIGYFTHVWKPSFKEFGATAEMQQELKRLNAQLTRLAPAILADPAAAKIVMKLPADGTDLNCHFKATQLDGATYIFAQNIDLGPGAEKAKQFDPIHPRGGKATISVGGLKAGTKVEVVDEERTITAEDGKFSDPFDALAEHIYKIKM